VASAESTPIRAVRESRASAAARRVGALVAQVPLGLAIVLAAGIVLRLVVSLVYQPALMNSADSPTYIVMADGGLFGDPVRTAGYPMFMIALRWVSDALAFTITVQHVLGVLTALLLYVIARRAGAPLWVATIGAAAVLLSLDQVVLEHIILSEALFTFLFVATLYACVRALDDPSPLYRALDSRHAWLFAAGLLLALCAWVRGVAAPLSPFLLLWILLAIPGSWRRRVVNAAVAAVAIAALMLTYFALNDARTGTFGLSQSPGWALYSRIAPIADCNQFTPPEGTESLCEATPPAARNGPDFYGWESGSPAIKLFTYPPNGDDELGAFAREAIRAQPRGYVQAVGTDVLRYFFPNYKTYAFGGLGYGPLDIQFEDRAIERDVWSYLSAVYTGVDQRKIEEPVTVLSEIQDWMRVQPLLMLAAVALAVAGIVFTRGRVRAVLVLLCGAGLLLFVIPSATATYNARYAIPSGGPLMLAGAMAAWALLSRLRGARDEAMPGSPRSHEAG
jgi:hypothetical protein